MGIRASTVLCGQFVEEGERGGYSAIVTRFFSPISSVNISSRRIGNVDNYELISVFLTVRSRFYSVIMGNLYSRATAPPAVEEHNSDDYKFSAKSELSCLFFWW